MSEAPLREGLLTKRGGGFPYKWQKRNFKLHAHGMEYFSGDVLKGTFCITHESKCFVTDEKPFSFSVTTGDDCLRMHSSSADETAEWVQAIGHVIEYCTAVAVGAELEYATKDLEDAADLQEGEDDGYADAVNAADSGSEEGKEGEEDKLESVPGEPTQMQMQNSDDVVSEASSFIESEDEDYFEGGDEAREMRARSRMKPKTYLQGNYSKIMEVVANVSSKPHVGTYCAYFDEGDDVFVRNDVYNGSGEEYYLDWGSVQLIGVEDPESLRYSGDLAPACVATYEDDHSIRVLIGMHCNAIVVWTVWTTETGWRDDSCAVFVALPPPLSAKEAKAADAADAAAAAKSKKAAASEAQEDEDDGEDTEVPSVYTLQVLQYVDDASSVQKPACFGVAVCGRSDGFVTYVNFTGETTDPAQRILFHNRIHGSGINVVGVAVFGSTSPELAGPSPSGGVPRRRASLNDRDKPVKVGNTGAVRAKNSADDNCKSYVFAGLFSGDIVRWEFSLSHLGAKQLMDAKKPKAPDGLTNMPIRNKAVPLSGRIELTDHTDAVTSFAFLENVYDECIETLEERNKLWCVFSGSDDFSVDMWHVSTGSLLRTFEGHEEGLTAVAIFSPTLNILDSILVTGSYDGMMKMWSVAQGTEISSNDIGYLDSICIVSNSTFLAPVDAEASAVVKSGRDVSQSLIFYVSAEDVEIRTMSTGCTTLDNQLFLPTTGIIDGHHHHRNVCTRALCCSENFIGQHVLIMTTGDDVRIVYSMDSQVVDDEDFNVIVSAADIGEIHSVQQLTLTERPKPTENESLVYGNVVTVLHSTREIANTGGEVDGEGEGEGEEVQRFHLSVYDVCAQADSECFECGKVAYVPVGGPLFHLFELGNRPMLAFLQEEERPGKNDKTVQVVLTKIYDICAERFVDDSFVMTQPAPEVSIRGVTDLKVMVNSDDGTFCAFISTTDKTGSIFVQPFGLKLGAEAGGDKAEDAEQSSRASITMRGTMADASKATKKIIEKKAKRMVGHQKRVNHLYCHYATKPGMSDYMVSASEDKTVRLWNPKTFQLVHVLTGHKTDICSLCSLPHPSNSALQEFIVSADVSGNINVWDCESGDLKRKLIDEPYEFIQLSWVNPKLLFSGGEDDATDLAEVQQDYMLVSSGGSSLSFWKLFEDGLPSRSELTKAFNADRAAARTKKSADRDLAVAEADAVAVTPDDNSSSSVMKKAVSIPFTSVALCISGCKDARALLAHCGSHLFRVAVNADLWCFVDEFLPMCPDVLLYESTFRKQVKTRNVASATGTKVEKTVQYFTLLEDAMIQQRLKSITVLLAAWTTLLSTAPSDLLAQIVFPFNALKKSELYYLASNYPKEFQDFIVGLKPLRAHESSLGDASSFPLGETKFHIEGVQARVPIEYNPSDGYSDWVKGGYVPHWLKYKKAAKEADVDDEIADQVVSAFFIPLKHAAAPELLLTYVDVCDDLGGDKSLFGCPVVVFAVRYAWKIYGRKLHLRSLQIYLCFVVIFMAGTFIYGFHIQDHINGPFWKAVNVVLQLLTIILNTYFLFMEGVQMLNADASMLAKYDRLNLAKADTKGEKASRNALEQVLSYLNVVELWNREIPGIIEYFSDFWNQIDVVMIVSIYISSFSHIVSYEESDIARCVLAVANILVWSKIMYFARSHSQGGPLIAMIVQIASDMKPFLLVLATILFGYAFSFWIMTYGTVDNAFNSVDGTLINSFSFMLGGFDPDAFSGIEVEGFAQFLSVVFMLIVSLLLLNLLIAIMGNSYGIVQERTKQQYRWEQASSIVDQLNLVLFPPSAEETLRMNPSMIHFVTRDSTFAKGSPDYCDVDGTDAAESEDPVVTQKEFSAQLNGLESRVLRHEKSKFNEVNDKIATLESKIDSLLGLVKEMGVGGSTTTSADRKKKKGIF